MTSQLNAKSSLRTYTRNCAIIIANNVVVDLEGRARGYGRLHDVGYGNVGVMYESPIRARRAIYYGALSRRRDCKRIAPERGE